MAKVFTITEGLENMGAMKTGGQGSVYKGRRIGEIFTAIKILPTPIHSESADDKNFTAFQNEVQKLKKVNETPNPNVVKILSSGITDSGNFPYIEMEFIEGPDLEELLKPPNEPVFTIKEVLKVAEQLSHALAHCHKLDVRHGDIKSNNIKFNAHTGNYVLLDFGLAIISDEQRRTSLRHAGAIEFMAPEQSEGLMLFQTDVYSFGVVLFELLAGTVPFPLKDKSETARNLVMVAHMETPAPNPLILRQQTLPQSWSDEKKAHEMQVSDWLLGMIYKCLQKKPFDRFPNGMELHDYFVMNSITSNNEVSSERLSALLRENKMLFREKEQLQQQLLQYQQGASGQDKMSSKITSAGTSTYPAQVPERNWVSRNMILLAVLTVIIVGAIIYTLIKNSTNEQQAAGNTVIDSLTHKSVIGQYRVLAAKAYFYNQPDENTKRGAYATSLNDVIKAFEEKNDFIYTEITNTKGQTSKGWLRKKDLITPDEWANRNKLQKPDSTAISEENINAKLNEARAYLNNNALPEALAIYSDLVKQEVPEAMYEYGNLALQNSNRRIDCSKAFDLVVKAADKGYTPAKRTAGFLYAFADDENVLQQNNYDRCIFRRNVPKGAKLLMEAMLQGDSAASRLLDELNTKSNLHEYQDTNNIKQ